MLLAMSVAFVSCNDDDDAAAIINNGSLLLEMPINVSDVTLNSFEGTATNVQNGNVITLAVAFRPTPSIAQLQQTIDLTTRTNTTIAVHGRHDACVVPRAVPVVESAVAIALLDEWMSVPQNNK